MSADRMALLSILVVLVFATITIGLWFIFRRKPSVPFGTPFEQPQIVLETPIEKPVVITENKESIKDWLRRQKTSDPSLGSIAIVNMAIEKFGKEEMDSIIRGVLQLEFQAVEIANLMIEGLYDCEEIALMLSNAATLSPKEVALIIMPLIKESALDSKVDKTFQIIKEVFGLDDEDEALVGLPKELGCNAEEAATIIYRNTDLRLAEAAKASGLLESPEIISKLAKDFDVDLSEEEEYRNLRDTDGLDFSTAVKILKACGVDLESILATESEYDNLDEEDLDDVLSSLRASCYSDLEILTGISTTDIFDDNVYAHVSLFAHDAEISMETVILFLKSSEVDLEDLDEEFREIGAEIEDRIKILNALINSPSR